MSAMSHEKRKGITNINENDKRFHEDPIILLSNISKSLRI